MGHLFWFFSSPPPSVPTGSYEFFFLFGTVPFWTTSSDSFLRMMILLFSPLLQITKISLLPPTPFQTPFSLPKSVCFPSSPFFRADLLKLVPPRFFPLLRTL